MGRKRQIDNWAHYYKIACQRPDLREFKSLLEVNVNQPRINLDLNEISTKDGVKTFKQLLNELAPKDDNEGSTI